MHRQTGCLAGNGTNSRGQSMSTEDEQPLGVLDTERSLRSVGTIDTESIGSVDTGHSIVAIETEPINLIDIDSPIIEPVADMTPLGLLDTTVTRTRSRRRPLAYRQLSTATDKTTESSSVAPSPFTVGHTASGVGHTVGDSATEVRMLEADASVTPRDELPETRGSTGHSPMTANRTTDDRQSTSGLRSDVLVRQQVPYRLTADDRHRFSGTTQDRTVSTPLESRSPTSTDKTTAAATAHATADSVQQQDSSTDERWSAGDAIQTLVTRRWDRQRSWQPAAEGYPSGTQKPSAPNVNRQNVETTAGPVEGATHQADVLNSGHTDRTPVIHESRDSTHADDEQRVLFVGRSQTDGDRPNQSRHASVSPVAPDPSDTRSSPPAHHGTGERDGSASGPLRRLTTLSMSESSSLRPLSSVVNTAASETVSATGATANETGRVDSSVRAPILSHAPARLTGGTTETVKAQRKTPEPQPQSEQSDVSLTPQRDRLQPWPGRVDADQAVRDGPATQEDSSGSRGVDDPPAGASGVPSSVTPRQIVLQSVAATHRTPDPRESGSTAASDASTRKTPQSPLDTATAGAGNALPSSAHRVPTTPALQSSGLATDDSDPPRKETVPLVQSLWKSGQTSAAGAVESPTGSATSSERTSDERLPSPTEERDTPAHSSANHTPQTANVDSPHVSHRGLEPGTDGQRATRGLRPADPVRDRLALSNLHPPGQPSSTTPIQSVARVTQYQPAPATPQRSILQSHLPVTDPRRTTKSSTPSLPKLLNRQHASQDSRRSSEERAHPESETHADKPPTEYPEQWYPLSAATVGVTATEGTLSGRADNTLSSRSVTRPPVLPVADTEEITVPRTGHSSTRDQIGVDVAAPHINHPTIQQRQARSTVGGTKPRGPAITHSRTAHESQSHHIDIEDDGGTDNLSGQREQMKQTLTVQRLPMTASPDVPQRSATEGDTPWRPQLSSSNPPAPRNSERSSAVRSAGTSGSFSPITHRTNQSGLAARQSEITKPPGAVGTHSVISGTNPVVESPQTSVGDSLQRGHSPHERDTDTSSSSAGLVARQSKLTSIPSTVGTRSVTSGSSPVGESPQTSVGDSLQHGHSPHERDSDTPSPSAGLVARQSKITSVLSTVGTRSVTSGSSPVGESSQTSVADSPQHGHSPHERDSDTPSSSAGLVPRQSKLTRIPSTVGTRSVTGASSPVGESPQPSVDGSLQHGHSPHERNADTPSSSAGLVAKQSEIINIPSTIRTRSVTSGSSPVGESPQTSVGDSLQHGHSPHEQDSDTPSSSAQRPLQSTPTGTIHETTSQSGDAQVSGRQSSASSTRRQSTQSSLAVRSPQVSSMQPAIQLSSRDTRGAIDTPSEGGRLRSDESAPTLVTRQTPRDDERSRTTPESRLRAEYPKQPASLQPIPVTQTDPPTFGASKGGGWQSRTEIAGNTGTATAADTQATPEPTKPEPSLSHRREGPTGERGGSQTDRQNRHTPEQSPTPHGPTQGQQSPSSRPASRSRGDRDTLQQTQQPAMGRSSQSQESQHRGTERRHDYPGAAHEPKSQDVSQSRPVSSDGTEMLDDRAPSSLTQAADVELSDVLASDSATDRLTGRLYRELERKMQIEKQRRGQK